MDGKNYREWAQSIKLLIDGKGKLGYLTGETKMPTDPVLLQRWRLENSLVIVWLVNSMKPSIGKTYLFLPTARDVWEAVKETYFDSENSAQIFEIKSRLWQKKQGEREVIDYYLEMTALWQELDLSSKERWKCSDDSVYYRKKLENERVFEFFAGLHRDLDDVRSRILGRKPPPSTREVFAEVRREESRRRVMMNGSGSNVEASGLVLKGLGPHTNGSTNLKNGPLHDIASNFGPNYSSDGPGTLGLYSKGSAIVSNSKHQKGRQKNETWEVVDLPKGKKPVECKRVFNIKYKANGTIERYKAHLVMKGYTNL